ncbi:MAG: HAMP domain-containing protein, partial [Bacteroidetes bacterium]|nr:HAMP domain-containing protein [Bacteroidota bacterium]
LLKAEAPVQNQYLQDYDIARDWELDVHLPLRVTFGATTAVTDTLRATRPLRSVQGDVLGQVLVERPAPEQLVQRLRTRYDDVLAFWATVLLVWMSMGAWWGLRAVPGRRLEHLGPRMAWGGGLILALVGTRYLLLLMDVPGRWQRGKAPLAPLFDPTHFASTIGGGTLRSTGDLLLTALFALALAFVLMELTSRFRAPSDPKHMPDGPTAPTSAAASLRFFGAVALVVLLVASLAVGLATVARRTVLDSTLDYFARSGLLPEPLVLVIFCALLLLTIAALVGVVSMIWGVLWARTHYGPSRRSVYVGGGILAAAVPLLGVHLVLGDQPVIVWVAVAALLVIGGAMAVSFARRGGPGQGLGLLTLRSILPSIFLLSLLLYPLFYSGMATQRQLRMVDAAETFDEGRDPRVVFAVEQLLEEVRLEPGVQALLDAAPSDPAQARLDSMAAVLLRSSLLASLGTYDVSLTFLTDEGVSAGRYDATNQTKSRAALDRSDALEFDILQRMYQESGSVGAMVEQVTGRREPERLQYEGILPIGEVGWVMARAEPKTLLRDTGTPFPRVLLPAGFFGELYASLSLAEFRDGVLVRGFGRDFGRYRLDEAVQQALRTQAELWNRETVKERSYLTYYRRLDQPTTRLPFVAVSGPTVVAVRVSAIGVFDHLYYLLRLTVAGLFIGIPFYLVGLWLRRRAGLLPAPRVRFRDKVLNAFLGVGVVAVTAVGFLGVQVVTEENERAVRSWLRQHLQDVEETLALETQGDEMPYRVLDRVSIDSVAARVGLDLNLYRDAELIASSRPQLVRERLIDERLPIAAYEALNFEGYQFTYVDERLGNFAYTAGYHALLDEQGQPRYVVSVPTLPEQERIEEERARTVAYLFGALLLLVLVVMMTASLLANALARPIARLRAGLEEVAKGHFEQTLPVDTRDEIGELVQTFNSMQHQLAESRRRLAQQERQLAWREMARQVAHEIKNPLTPMKLSVQHLRRAFQDAGSGATNGRFETLFERVTSTLIEQIETLARIANDFSTFARMPTRVLERLDLNAVIQEAADLMQAEAEAEIELDLHPEPLVVKADRKELRRVYINLIKNALQALEDRPDGCVTITTSVEAGSDIAAPGVVRSTVQDTGTGIPADLRGKIFEPNFSTKTSGTGLGLAIARKSIEELDGTIGFETEEGVGTTFWVRLPLVGES